MTQRDGQITGNNVQLEAIVPTQTHTKSSLITKCLMSRIIAINILFILYQSNFQRVLYAIQCMHSYVYLTWRQL